MAKKQSGSEHARRAGLVPVQLLVSPEEHERLRAAAFLAGDRGMAGFCRRVVNEQARKLVSDNDLKEFRKKSQIS